MTTASANDAQTLPQKKADCLHCGSIFLPEQTHDKFCCRGCQAVYRLLTDENLQDYYKIRPPRILPLLNYFDRSEKLNWIDQLPGTLLGRVDFSIEGLQCGACVWAVERFADKAGGAAVQVNTALGRLSIRFDPKKFNLKSYLKTLRAMGYRVLPASQKVPDRSQSLLLRLGICSAIAMNAMFFSISLYLGLKPGPDGLYAVMHQLNFALAAISVLVGGSYFFQRAWISLRRGVLHFDVPIALGIAASFLGSAWLYSQGRASETYFDTLTVFVALMIAGRFVQERSLLKNRRSLLKAESFEKFYVTTLEPTPKETLFSQVKKDTLYLLQPGSLVPVASTFESATEAEFDFKSVSGEPQPRILKQGTRIEAGARLLSSHPVRAQALEAFTHSLLSRLLPPNIDNEESMPLVWRWVTRWYVFLVLLAAFSGLAWWSLINPAMAPQVFISVLVVTCPCGLGIAIPLARTMANRSLLAQGVVAQSPDYLDRLMSVRKVFMDKTGTLTLSTLTLNERRVFDTLSKKNLSRLMAAAVASRHPVSRAIYAELSARGVQAAVNGRAEEHPGQGVWWHEADQSWLLGRPPTGRARAAFSLEGKKIIAQFSMSERLLEDAPEAIHSLQKQGLQISILSGDTASRVGKTAQRLGIQTNLVHARALPQKKADTLDKNKNSLMIGDGLNDGPAFDKALVSGAPAWERSVITDKADFYFVSSSLAWLPAMFTTAARLKNTIKLNLAFAIIYNSAVVSLALTGNISPLVSALIMPASSLLVLVLTTRSMTKE